MPFDDSYVSSSPASGAVAITPSDTTTYAPTRALFVGGAGNAVVKMAAGNTVTFACQAGQVLPIQVTAVLASTTATSIVGLW